MSTNTGSCYKYEVSPIIILKDPTNPKNKKGPVLKIINKNKERIRIGQVDGCLVTNNEIRCDFEVFYEDILSSFIELKGSDIKHAIEQIKNSIRLVGFSKAKNRVCLIICNRCPMASTQIQLFKKYFRKHFKSQLEVKKSGYEYSIPTE